MEIITGLINSYNLYAEYLAIFFWISLLFAFILNINDSNRVWILSTFFIVYSVDILLIRSILPQELITRQTAYSLIDLTIILLLKYRVVICRSLLYVSNSNSEKNSFIHDVLTNIDCTKQEYAIRRILKWSIAINIALIAEHLARHPDFIGFDARPDLQSSMQTLFVLYPLIKTILTSGIVLGLLSMTLEGWENRKSSKNILN
ncbi:hypothetical protein [Pseudoalteromonas sp. Of7M-16]|uniref:hypothetical protein n=1 Tax=Pseudoalteromonas sp. Of7M-16 TaxID=2917756 RepID=UPI001EF74243|nr:hypothetical protein [Pseudoalteromonas sp. Of7M-16]MCG7551593.1 hypothetical protein [Pseudoalteromonas sp. Of7M-16]